jgi:hypothetical protein
MLIWTIHDFPGYGTVGGFANQGFATCPWRREDLDAEHSTELGKQTYGGCRRWLPADYILRSNAFKAHFNRQSEDRRRPRRISVEDQVRFGEEYATWRVAGNRDSGPEDPSKKHDVKRNNILL